MDHTHVVHTGSADDTPAEWGDELDAVWGALASPWRRRILDVLREGPATTGEVVDAIGSGRHMVLQHLAVLRDADLVITEKRGRNRVNHLNAVPIRQIYERWVSRYEGTWAEALTGLKRDIEHEREADLG